MKRFLLLILLLLPLALTIFALASCDDGAGGGAATRYTSYRDIPGVTDDEIAAVEALRASRGAFVYGMNYSSEAFHGDDGQVRGFSALMCEYLSELFGIPFKPATFEWDSLISGLESGAISFSGELTPTDERRKAGYIMTDPIAMRHVASFRLRGGEPAGQIAERRPLRYAFLEGTVTENDVVSASAYKIEPVYVGDYDVVYKMLKNREIDAFFDENSAEGIFDSYGDVVVEAFLPISYSPVALSTRDAALAPVISVVQKKLNAGGRQYLASLYDLGKAQFAKHRFERTLTDIERGYMTARPTVPVAAESDNYPICFYNENEKRFDGVFIDILREIEGLTGMCFEIVNKPNATWPEVLAKLENRSAEMISELIRSESREGKFLWPATATMTDNFALMSMADKPYVSINNVMDMRVGQMEGTAHDEQFRRWFPDHAHIIEYIDIAKAADALERGEVDLVMAGQNPLRMITNYMERPGFKVNILFDKTYESYIGFNIGSENLASVVDKALMQIDLERISGHWARRTYDYRAKVARTQQAWLLGAAAILLCAVIFLVIIYKVSGDLHVLSVAARSILGGNLNTVVPIFAKSNKDVATISAALQRMTDRARVLTNLVKDKNIADNLLDDNALCDDNTALCIDDDITLSTDDNALSYNEISTNGSQYSAIKEPSTPEDADSSPVRASLRNVDGLDADTAVYNMGGAADVYEDSVRSFVKFFPEILGRAEECLQSADFKNFATEIHSIKGALNNIGAYILGDEAACLEDAAKSGDIHYCKENHPHIIERLTDFHKKVAGVFPDECQDEKPSGNIDTLKTALENAKTAVDGFDALEAKGIMADIGKYSYGTDIDALIEEITDSLSRFDCAAAGHRMDKILTDYIYT